MHDVKADAGGALSDIGEMTGDRIANGSANLVDRFALGKDAFAHGPGRESALRILLDDKKNLGFSHAQSPLPGSHFLPALSRGEGTCQGATRGVTGGIAVETDVFPMVSQPRLRYAWPL